MAVFSIPLTNQNQNLQISILNVVYTLTMRWNALANSGNGLWFLDINDVNNNPILNGIPCVAGIDLLQQFKYLGIGGHIVAQDIDTPTLPITYNNLGQSGQLLFIPYAS